MNILLRKRIMKNGKEGEKKGRRVKGGRREGGREGYRKRERWREKEGMRKRVPSAVVKILGFGVRQLRSSPSSTTKYLHDLGQVA